MCRYTAASRKYFSPVVAGEPELARAMERLA
jgi:hypothetical protein